MVLGYANKLHPNSSKLHHWHASWSCTSAVFISALSTINKHSIQYHNLIQPSSALISSLTSSCQLHFDFDICRGVRLSFWFSTDSLKGVRCQPRCAAVLNAAPTTPGAVPASPGCWKVWKSETLLGLLLEAFANHCGQADHDLLFWINLTKSYKSI